MVKVLVVDDEKMVTDAYVNVLKSSNYDAVGALNAAEAFKALEEFKPDIILLDINLKEKLTGVDVQKKAMELNPKVQTAVVTGLGKDPLVDEAQRAGAKTVIQKPVSISNILDTVAKFAENIQKDT